MDIKGYERGERVHAGRTFNVYRGIRTSDQQPVILKTCRSERPAPYELAILQHEYRLLQQLDAPGIIRAHALVKHQHNLVLVLEDKGSQSLRQYLQGRPVDIADFFPLALQIIEALGALHRRSIIHKDVNPDNILIHPDSLAVTLIDLNLASQAAQDAQESVQLHNLEGTLAYIAPEQTGRINRVIDHRADFYALGVTFYELLTGRVPFQAHDPLELVYCHLAKTPEPLSALNPKVPSMLEAIVLKLLAKTPEDRYASVLGLQKDVKECQKQWQDKQAIETFPLGQYDISDRLVISQKLYGREEQVAQLLGAFERVNQGQKELLFAAGYSGVGKTSLVREIYQPVTRQRGYFVSGKYDQLQRTTPYSAFIEAFEQLIRLLLAEPEERLQRLKHALREAVGNTGQVIIDVIPNAALLLGDQPPVPPLAPQEAQNRFMITFQNFVRALAQPDHPLVVFLDDLQWADSASLQLLKLIITDSEVRYLLVIGAYRDNEVSADHPLMLTQLQLQKDKVPLEAITLAPLVEEDIQHLLADTLSCNVNDTSSLSSVLFAKTHGNPYFLNQFLKKLYQDNILTFSYDKGQWQWNMERLAQEDMTDNVVDLLSDRIRQLPEATQNALKLAACIGHTFDLQTLAVITERPLKALAKDLVQAVEGDFIRPSNEAARLAAGSESETPPAFRDKIVYSFAHDRIQQSAYQLIKENQRQSVHVKIGRLLIGAYPLQEQDERLFDIVNHFNASLPLITDTEEKLQIAEANLWAGKRAKAATAYAIADDYLKAGVSLLPENAWQNHYALTFALHREAAECKYLTVNYEDAQDYFTRLLEQAQGLEDKVAIYKLQIIILNTLPRLREALEVGIRALQELGVKLPRHPTLFHILKMMLKVKGRIGSKRVEDIQLAPLTDVRIRLAMEICQHMAATAYVLDQKLLLFLILL